MTVHLRVPFALDSDGTAQTLAQGSDEEIRQSVQVLLSTPLAARLVVPEYGAPDLTFTTQQGGHLAVLEAAVQRWEPRAAGTQIPIRIDGTGHAEVVAGVPTNGR